jgi:hypothetical protein
MALSQPWHFHWIGIFSQLQVSFTPLAAVSATLIIPSKIESSGIVRASCFVPGSPSTCPWFGPPIPVRQVRPHAKSLRLGADYGELIHTPYSATIVTPGLSVALTLSAMKFPFMACV